MAIKSEYGLLQKLATYHGRQIAESIVKNLQLLTGSKFHVLEGDDPALKGIWEEICYQVQCEYSPYWQAYMETIANHIESELESADACVRLLLGYVGSARLLHSEECFESSPRTYSPDIAKQFVFDMVLGIAMEYKSGSLDSYTFGYADEHEGEDEQEINEGDSDSVATS